MAGATPANHIAPNPPQTAAPAFGSISQLPLWFEPNQGQAEAQARFLARGPGYRLLLHPDQVALELGHPAAGAKAPSAKLRLKLPGAQPRPHLSGEDQLAGKVNYFRGQDPAKWRTGIPTYARVKYHAIYPGVDLVFYGRQRQLEFDFVVAPGADPRQIRLAFEGADNLSLDATGNLVLQTGRGQVIAQAPQVYQVIAGQRRAVAGRYRLEQSPGREVGLEIAAYDTTQPLVIDPVLVYARWIEGSDADRAYGIAVDGAGCAYLTGLTGSTNLPVTPGAFQPLRAGGTNAGIDVFVLKLNPAGTELVYGTYLGGDGSETGYYIAVDAGGNAYIAGTTTSTNFPVRNAVQSTRADPGTNSYGQDLFIAKLDPSGSELLYSTYLGGSSYDYCNGLAVDTSGAVYVAGTTRSTNFPTTALAFQPHPSPSASTWYYDAFVTKLDPTGSALVYSTYLGGSSHDQAGGIAIDAAGHAYVVGNTWSTDFPVNNAFQSTLANSGYYDYDAFVTKLAPDGASLVFSTYLGGNDGDYGWAVAVDGSGNTFVAGMTYSTNFPTAHALQPNLDGTPITNGYGQTTLSDAFVAKLDPSGSTLLFSTYLGGSDYDWIHGLRVDAAGNACVAGVCNSYYVPGYFIERPWAARLNADGSALSTLYTLDPLADDCRTGDITDLALDAAGNLYLAGYLWNTDSAGSGSTSFDALVMKIDAAALAANPPVVSLVTAPLLDVFGAQANLTLSAHAVDLGGRVERVAFYSGASLLGAATNFPYSITAGNLPIGSYTFTAVAYDDGGLAATSCPVAIRIVLPPPNDRFANRIILQGTNFTASGSNVGASGETNEVPLSTLDPSYARSVWWSWTAPTDGKFTLTTEGSDFDARLGVFTGSALTNLTKVCAGSGRQPGDVSLTSFRATAGTTYQIVVDGRSGACGNIRLTLRPANPPPNDDFANRIGLAGLAVTNQASNLEATMEPGEPNPYNYGKGHSLWWTWTAPTNGSFIAMTGGSEISTIVSLFTGETLSNLTLVAYDVFYGTGDQGGSARFQASAGTVYLIQVDGVADYMGQITLTLAYQPPPPHDNFADRIAISGTTATLAGTTVGATREPDEPAPSSGIPGASVWWSWTAPADGHCTLCNQSNRYTIVRVYEGDELTNLVQVVSGSGSVSFTVVAGVTYQIAIDPHAGEVGEFAWTLRPALSPPNDDFANRTLLAGMSVADRVSVLEASAEPGETSHYNSTAPAVRSVWWTWTAPTNGAFTISTAGSDCNTALAVYTGDTLSNLVRVARDAWRSGDGNSKLSLNATAGVIYQIAVDAPSDPGTNAQVNIVFTPPPANDNFADRIPLSGLPVTVTNSNAGATVEFVERYSYGGWHSIWWTWTAPADGPVKVTAAGNGFNPVVGVFLGDNLTNLSRVVSDSRAQPGRAVFKAVAGMTYQISIDGDADGFGDIALSIVGAHPPANDDFANRIILSGEQTQAGGSIFDASAEPREPAHTPYYDAATASAWWSWTAPWSGRVTLSNDPAPFIPLLSVYTGAELSTLRRVVSSSGSPYPSHLDTSIQSLGGIWISPEPGPSVPSSLPSRSSMFAPSLPRLLRPGAQVSFDAVAGTTYQISVDGDYGDTGEFTLRLAMPPPVIRLSALSFGDDRFLYRLNGPQGLGVIIETSTNLVDWTPLATTTLTNATVDLEDADPHPARFYRARALP